MICHKCNVEMVRGKAIEQTWVPTGEKWGDAEWMKEGGAGRLVECLKCPACGRSVTDGRS